MDIDALTDDDRKQLAKDLAAELDTGLYGNRAVLSRRQLLSLAGGVGGVAGLVALGVDPATAQSAAGQVGTQSSPEDVFAFDLDVQNGATFNGNDVTGVGSLSTKDVIIDEVFRTSVTEETISSGSIPYSSPYIAVSGAGDTSDDLDNIIGGTDGDIVILRRVDETITVRDGQGGSGQFFLGASERVLDNSVDRLVLQRSTNDRWCELTFSDNF